MDDNCDLSITESGFSTRDKIECGLATPSLSIGSNNNSSADIGLNAELTYQHKLLKFKEYLEYNGIYSRPVSRYKRIIESDDNYKDEDEQTLITDEYYQDATSGHHQENDTMDDSIPYNEYHLPTPKPKQFRTHLDEHDLLRYYDSLFLQAVGFENEIEGVEDYKLLLFRNNIGVCWSDYDYVAFGSMILILENFQIIDTIETRPGYTTRQQIDSSTLPEEVHSINFLKVSKLNNKDVLSIACDDGRVLVYELFEDSIPKLYAEMQLTSSVWGIDSKGDYIVASNNSHSITLFLIKEGNIYFHTTTKLLHNIPDLKIIRVSNQIVEVTCISISGELVIFEFNIYQEEDSILCKVDLPITINILNHEPKNRYKITSEIKKRLLLKDNGWTVNIIQESVFKETDINYNFQCSKILNMIENSKILELTENELVTSNIGGSTKYEKLFIETGQGPSYTDNENDYLNDFTQNITRVKNHYLRTNWNQNKKFTEPFLLVTTSNLVGLYSGNELICNAYTGKVFNFMDDSDFFDRLSITEIIPELNAVIIVTQAAKFSVFRFIKARGVYTMREEYHESLSENDDIICGCYARKISDSQDLVYQITLVVYPNRFLTYRIREPDLTDELIVDSLI